MSHVPATALSDDGGIDVRDRVIDIREPVVDVRDHTVDAALAGLGLCGRCDEPSGRRCFRKAGHEGRCSLLRVSDAFRRGVTTALGAPARHDG